MPNMSTGAPGITHPLPFAPIKATYAEDGHVTVPGVFPCERMDGAIADATAWGEEALAAMSAEERAWYAENAGASSVLRKLDNPHKSRAVFEALARDATLVGLVEGLIGRGVSVYFSQVFFKPPHGGGPKPAHQDNYYFGPSDPDGLVTAWIALEDADEANGCLRYGRGTHRGPILPHTAPEDRPFDLQLSDTDLAGIQMRPAPVPKGGVSFHHGGTVHRSADNRSARWRRACALHYVRSDVVFQTPALPYDGDLVLKITDA
ncbi:MAG: phytanoyl-CoA dioxygenase family protein [Pseudomonadota bacterium]